MPCVECFGDFYKFRIHADFMKRISELHVASVKEILGTDDLEDFRRRALCVHNTFCQGAKIVFAALECGKIAENTDYRDCPA